MLGAYRRRALSPVETMASVIERVEAYEPHIHATWLYTPERALKEARASEARWAKGEPIGPLDGVPVTIKDLMLMRGFPTLRGSQLVDPNQDWPEDSPAVARLREACAGLGAEVAHLKAIGLHDVSFGVANLVSSGTEPELSLPSHGRVPEAEVIVNARVAADPAVLEQQVRQTVEAVCHERGARAEFLAVQSFRPGRPQPTHRYATAK